MVSDITHWRSMMMAELVAGKQLEAQQWLTWWTGTNTEVVLGDVG